MAATDQAVMARFCDSNSEIILMEDEEIAVIQGGSQIDRTAKDHAVLANSRAWKCADIRRMEDDAIEAIAGKFANTNTAKDHDVFAKLCG